MSKNKKNIYVQKARQKALMGTNDSGPATETKHNVKKTLAYTGRDILLGGLGGALAGALVGRTSFLLGVVVSGAGHFLGSPGTAMFGVGLMASGGYQSVAGAFNGVEKDGMEGVKERLNNFKETLKRQLFLDKLPSKKKTDEAKQDTKEETTNGLNGENGTAGLDYTEANRLEEQIRQSARDFESQNGVEGTGQDDVGGLGEIENRII